MRRRFVTLDVFTGKHVTGNPLAVVLDAERVDDIVMQMIACEFNLAETVFVLPAPSSGTRKLSTIFE